MAKKKTKKTVRAHLLSPVSLKRSISYVALFALISSINIYAFINLPNQEPIKAVSQTDLMKVLGDSVTLGSQTEGRYASFYQKPEIAYWQELLKKTPDFRDAHLILAAYAYNHHNCQLAQSHILSARSIDPTYQYINLITPVIEDCN